MDALTLLQQLLRPSVDVAAQPFRHCANMDKVLAEMESKAATGSKPYEPQDQIQKAVSTFWANPFLYDLKQARLVSFGLGLTVNSSGQSLLDDRDRFRAVLDSQTGVGQWKKNPRAFRRCYQGLVRSYFSFDPNRTNRSLSAKENWPKLRDYLFEHNGLIQSEYAPKWVELATRHQTLFTSNPCSPYADQLLQGDTSTVEELKGRLGIPENSWFIDELILSQVQNAVRLTDIPFNSHVVRLVELLEPHILVRNKGLTLLLDRYAKQPNPIHHRALSDAAVSWWGNPWLPSNTAQWGGVSQAARTMVADWLRQEFVVAFFTKLAEDGAADTRRMKFWLRYVKNMTHLQFALGSHARSSRDKDMVVLRGKMKGLISELNDGPNNAFIMHMGDFVAVEFSGASNAFYGYDARRALPFDYNQAVSIRVDGRNSLKTSSPQIKLRHQDGIHGWEDWEDMFEATLEENFGISPAENIHRTQQRTRPHQATSATNALTNADSNRSVSYTWKSVEHLPYTRFLLEKLANEDGLVLEDNTDKGGALWVRCKLNDNPDRARVLRKWELKFAPGKGWYRDKR